MPTEELIFYTNHMSTLDVLFYIDCISFKDMMLQIYFHETMHTKRSSYLFNDAKFEFFEDLFPKALFAAGYFINFVCICSVTLEDDSKICKMG